MLDCGHPEIKSDGVLAGYGKDSQGRKFCYDCCHKLDLEEIQSHNDYVGYVSLEKGQIVNWPGYSVMRIVASWNRRHNIAGKLLHIQAKDQFGNEWYGDGPGDGMYIKLHKAKRLTT
jgi:hypothetical protein